MLRASVLPALWRRASYVSVRAVRRALSGGGGRAAGQRHRAQRISGALPRRRYACGRAVGERHRAAQRPEGGEVAGRGDLRAAEALAPGDQLADFDVSRRRLAAQVDFKDLVALRFLRERDFHDFVKAAGPDGSKRQMRHSSRGRMRSGNTFDSGTASGVRWRRTVFRWSFAPGPPNDHRLPSVNPPGWAGRRVEPIQPVGGPQHENVFEFFDAVQLGQELAQHAVGGRGVGGGAAAGGGFKGVWELWELWELCLAGWRWRGGPQMRK